MSLTLPSECLEMVLVLLVPYHRFRIATDFRLLFIRDRTVPLLEFASSAHTFRKGQCDLLQVCWKNKSWLQGISEGDIDSASIHGHVAILEWLADKCKKKPFPCTFRAIQGACDNGHVAVLDWWHKTERINLQKYYSPIVIHASGCGHISILEWTLRTGLFNVWTNHPHYVAIERASQNGHVHVLQWWLQKTKKIHGFPDMFSGVMDEASRHGHVHLLEWWKDTAMELGIELEYSMRALESSKAPLEWWKSSGLLFRHEESGCLLSIVSVPKKKNKAIF